METADNKQQTANSNDQTKSVILYDADAEQRIPFETERRVGGVARLYPVTHIFGPITDDPVFEYERGRGQTLGEAATGEIDQTGGTAIEARKGAEAALKYWNSTGALGEGYAGKISDRDKIFAVNLLFGLEFDELPTSAADELCPEEDDGASTYSARCIYNGHIIPVSASLRPATNGEISEFIRLTSRTILARGQQFGKQDMFIPAIGKRLAELFNSMKVGSTGYAGRIPAHHRVAYARRHFQSEQKAITGN